MTATRIETDVLVVGSGMAGLVAAVRALESGADVLLVEKGPELGGTTRITGGYLAVDEDAPPNVAPFEPIRDGLDWLEGHGVTVDESEEWGHGESVAAYLRIDPPQFVDRMAAVIEGEGGTIRRRTPFERLRTDDAGRVCGAVAHDERADERLSVAAPSVVLATGGRSGNAGIVEGYYPGHDLPLGRDPWSTADGFLAATDVGAKTTGGLSAPIGVTRPAPPAEIGFEDMRCGQIYDTSSVALTEAGERFTDESAADTQSDAFVATYLREVSGPIWLVIDRDVYENDTRYQSPVSERLELARELGGVVLEAETVGELCAALADQGVDGDRARETIETFNATVRGEAEVALDPPRTDYREPVDTPPFYATKVRPAILYFVGGLDVDERARVLSRARSTSTLSYAPGSEAERLRTPIPGLYAAGVEVGKRTEDGYYSGGLSLALATGRIAGEHAATYARGTRETEA